MKKQELLFYLFNIFIPIVIGVCIYCIYDSNVIFVKYINSNLIINNKETNIFITFLRNYFCDFCWCYSFAFALSFINHKSLDIIYTVIIPISFGICLEIFQLLNITNGTFDLLDIIVELLGCILCYMVLKIRSVHSEINIKKIINSISDCYILYYVYRKF